MKKITFIFILISLLQYSKAQEKNIDIKSEKFNVEFTAGILNATPVGIYAKELRTFYKEIENSPGEFKGSLLPKTSAYVGINFDYKVHSSLGIGTGLTYTPKGYWDFTSDKGSNYKSKKFTTVDYFEMPIFIKGYFSNNKLALRFGPVLNFTVISKQRNITTYNDEKVKEKYRIGENGSPLPKEIVPGIETGLSFGKLNGLHGDLLFQYMGSMFKELDARSVVFKLGIAYTISK